MVKYVETKVLLMVKYVKKIISAVTIIQKSLKRNKIEEFHYKHFSKCSL